MLNHRLLISDYKIMPRVNEVLSFNPKNCILQLLSFDSYPSQNGKKCRSEEYTMQSNN